VTFRGSKKSFDFAKIYSAHREYDLFIAWKYSVHLRCSRGRMLWQGTVSSIGIRCPNAGASNVIIVADQVDANST